VSIEGVKRPRGRPPLPETLKRRMQAELQSQSSALETPKQPSPTVASDDQPSVAQAPLSSVVNPPTVESPAAQPPPPVPKKRPKPEFRGMDRLLIKQTGSKVNGSAKRPSKCPPVAAELTQRSRQEAASESPKVGKQSVAEVGKQPVEVAADQNIPSLSSPMWQPASKRVLDAVCVTDVTAGSGVTITVRESSVIDGFFRSRAE